ncbi:MAG: hypothetical protein ABH812_02015 [bacterium]
MSKEIIRGIRDRRVVEPQISHTLLSRETMRHQLGSVAGMVYHVGSDPSPVEEGFRKIVIPEAERFGFVSWLQRGDSSTGMVVSPYYHPDLGLTLDEKGKIQLNDTNDKLLETLTGAEGMDFHLDAAPGWYYLLNNFKQMPPITVLKTQIASPTCSSSFLSDSAFPWHEAINSALVKGHLLNARKLSKVVIVSVDDPNSFSIETLRANFEIMFDDKFDGNNRLVEEGEQVMRAIHCCGDWSVLEVMATGAVDVVHYDTWQYGEAPIIGQPQILSDYLLKGGLIAWGGIPQNFQYLSELANKLSLPSITINSLKDYEGFAQILEDKRKEAADLIFKRYSHWFNKVSLEAGIDMRTLARKVFISATCGYGTNLSPSLRDFSYKLARDVADLTLRLAR